MNDLKVLQLGAGRHGRNHASVYHKLGKQVHIYDQKPERAKKVAEEFNHIAIEDPKTIENKIDIVDICIPTPYHYAEAMCYLKKDKHLFLEKPPTNNAKECLQIESENMRNHPEAVIMVGFVENYNASPQTIKNIIHKCHETILNIDCIRYGPTPPENPHCGVLEDLTVHDIALAMDFLKDDPTSARADLIYNDTRKDKYPTKAHMNLWFDESSYGNDVICTLNSSWKSAAKVRLWNITTDQNHYMINLAAQKAWKIKEFEGKTYTDFFDLMNKTGNLEPIEIEKNEPLLEEFKHFFECIETGQQPKTDMNYGYSVMCVLDAVKRWPGKRVGISEETAFAVADIATIF